MHPKCHIKYFKIFTKEHEWPGKTLREVLGGSRSLGKSESKEALGPPRRPLAAQVNEPGPDGDGESGQMPSPETRNPQGLRSQRVVNHTTHRWRQRGNPPVFASPCSKFAGTSFLWLGDLLNSLDFVDPKSTRLRICFPSPFALVLLGKYKVVQPFWKPVSLKAETQYPVDALCPQFHSWGETWEESSIVHTRCAQEVQRGTFVTPQMGCTQVLTSHSRAEQNGMLHSDARELAHEPAASASTWMTLVGIGIGRGKEARYGKRAQPGWCHLHANGPNYSMCRTVVTLGEEGIMQSRRTFSRSDHDRLPGRKSYVWIICGFFFSFLDVCHTSIKHLY